MLKGKNKREVIIDIRTDELTDGKKLIFGGNIFRCPSNMYECPDCGQIFIRYANLNYCYNCGVKIRWINK